MGCTHSAPADNDAVTEFGSSSGRDRNSNPIRSQPQQCRGGATPPLSIVPAAAAVERAEEEETATVFFGSATKTLQRSTTISGEGGISTALRPPFRLPSRRMMHDEEGGDEVVSPTAANTTTTTASSQRFHTPQSTPNVSFQPASVQLSSFLLSSAGGIMAEEISSSPGTQAVEEGEDEPHHHEPEDRARLVPQLSAGGEAEGDEASSTPPLMSTTPSGRTATNPFVAPGTPKRAEKLRSVAASSPSTPPSLPSCAEPSATTGGGGSSSRSFNSKKWGGHSTNSGGSGGSSSPHHHHHHHRPHSTTSSNPNLTSLLLTTTGSSFFDDTTTTVMTITGMCGGGGGGGVVVVDPVPLVSMMVRRGDSEHDEDEEVRGGANHEDDNADGPSCTEDAFEDPRSPLGDYSDTNNKEEACGLAREPSPPASVTRAVTGGNGSLPSTSSDVGLLVVRRKRVAPTSGTAQQRARSFVLPTEMPRRSRSGSHTGKRVSASNVVLHSVAMPAGDSFTSSVVIPPPEEELGDEAHKFHHPHNELQRTGSGNVSPRRSKSTLHWSPLQPLDVSLPPPPPPRRDLTPAYHSSTDASLCGEDAPPVTIQEPATTTNNDRHHHGLLLECMSPLPLPQPTPGPQPLEVDSCPASPTVPLSSHTVAPSCENVLHHILQADPSHPLPPQPPPLPPSFYQQQHFPNHLHAVPPTSMPLVVPHSPMPNEVFTPPSCHSTASPLSSLEESTRTTATMGHYCVTGGGGGAASTNALVAFDPLATGGSSPPPSTSTTNGRRLLSFVTTMSSSSRRGRATTTTPSTSHHHPPAPPPPPYQLLRVTEGEGMVGSEGGGGEAAINVQFLHSTPTSAPGSFSRFSHTMPFDFDI